MLIQSKMREPILLQRRHEDLIEQMQVSAILDDKML